MEETQRFAALVAGPERALDLDEAALLIAAHARPGLDVATYLRRLDDLAAAVRAPDVDGICKYLFDECRFAGNEHDYYDPQNSYLDRVLDRRLGIPITFSVLLIEVGRRLGLSLAAVAMPGHVLVADLGAPGELVDPFAAGARLDHRSAEALSSRRVGAGQPFRPEYLTPVGPRIVVERMLANLDVIATARGDRIMLAWVMGLRVTLPGTGARLHRRHASVLADSGRFDQAADVLETLANSAQGDAVGDRARALRLRARLS